MLRGSTSHVATCCVEELFPWMDVDPSYLRRTYHGAQVMPTRSQGAYGLCAASLGAQAVRAKASARRGWWHGGRTPPPPPPGRGRPQEPMVVQARSV